MFRHAFLFCYFISPSLLSLFKKTNKQPNKNANFYLLSLYSRICHCILLHPTLVDLFTSVSFYFSLLLFFFFLSLIFGLFKPMSLFPFVGLWFQNSTIPTGISRTRVKKGYQIAEVGDSWKQSSIKGQRV